MAEDRNWYCNGIVADREDEILANELPRVARNRNGLGHGEKTVVQEDEVGGIASDIGGGGWSHGCMRGGEGRRVVETVADHKHALSCFCQINDVLRFVHGGDAGAVG